MTGFSFYDPENGYPWDYPDLKAPNAEFGKELSRLQIWLTKRLRELRDRAAKARETVTACRRRHAAASGPAARLSPRAA